MASCGFKRLKRTRLIKKIPDISRAGSSLFAGLFSCTKLRFLLSKSACGNVDTHKKKKLDLGTHDGDLTI